MSTSDFVEAAASRAVMLALDQHCARRQKISPQLRFDVTTSRLACDRIFNFAGTLLLHVCSIAHEHVESTCLRVSQQSPILTLGGSVWLGPACSSGHMLVPAVLASAGCPRPLCHAGPLRERPLPRWRFSRCAVSSAASVAGTEATQADLESAAASPSTATGGDGSDNGSGSGRNADSIRATDEEDEPENVFSYTGWNPIQRYALPECPPPAQADSDRYMAARFVADS